MKERNDYGVFDIIGPIMIGPSSSHTAGAVRMGLLAGQLCKYNPKEIWIDFAGTLAHTHRAHKTDIAVVAGVLGFNVDDERVRSAFDIAAQRGIPCHIRGIDLPGAHAGTAIITVMDESGKKRSARAATIGGGNITAENVDGLIIRLDGKQNGIICLLPDNKADALENRMRKALSDICLTDFVEIRKGENCIGAFIERPLTEQEERAVLNLLNADNAIVISEIMPSSKGGLRFYTSCSEWADAAKKDNISLSEAVIRHEMAYSKRCREDVVSQMRENFMAMKEAIKQGLGAPPKLYRGIMEAGAQKLERFRAEGRSLIDPMFTTLISRSLGVMEYSATMGRIVACPTASCGGFISTVATVAEHKNIPDDKVIQAMFTGAGIGIICAETGTISGSVGGCQSELGASCAMAAATLAEVFNGDPRQIFSAATFAIGNMLGLVCDPLGGLVEIPCIQRNTITAANAVLCAEMGLAGIDAYVPVDEAIDALRQVGEDLPTGMKGKLGGGLSATPTGKRIEKEITGK